MITRPLPKPLQKPYIPAREIKAMTVVTGFVCEEGIVLAADREVSSKGFHKFYSEKIFMIEAPSGIENLFLAYSGSPHLVQEVVQRITAVLSTLGENEVLGNQALRSTCQDILFEISQRTYEKNLQALLITDPLLEQQELWCFNQDAFHKVNEYEFLGVGESSVLRYIFETLYTPKLTLEQMKGLAIHAIAKAKKYIDGCGGETDVLVAPRASKWQWINPAEIQRREQNIERLEKTDWMRNIISLS